MKFDHEKLEVYRVSIDTVAAIWRLTENIPSKHRHIKDQLVRASQSIPLNIAEGNGKRAYRDRNRYFEIARGSAMECAAALDVLSCCDGVRDPDVVELKALLVRVVSMFYKMTELRGVREDAGAYFDDEDDDDDEADAQLFP